MKWDKTFFEQRFSEIYSFEEQINETVAKLKRRDGTKRIAKALSKSGSGSMFGWLGGSLPAHLVSSGFTGPPLTLGLGSPLPLLDSSGRSRE